MSNQQSKTIVLTSGGTGGHMYPAGALAADLKTRGYHVEVITDARGSKFGSIFGSTPVHVIQASSLGGGVIRKLRGALYLAMGMVQAAKLLKRIKPAVVVGFGGYPSLPAVFVAQRRGIPTIIHEQNAVMGRANSFLAPHANRIAISLPHVVGLDPEDAVRTVVTGNPVREEIAALCTKPYPAPSPQGPFRVFVMGGSMGANVFADVVPAALARLPAALRARLDITQQCREEGIDKARQVYADAGIRARLETFFGDVPDTLSRTHLVISRSGASTVAEVTAAGRPAIFVPYPHHDDQQQKINADTVADAGGAWVMTQEGFTEESLLARIEPFLQNPETLFRAAEASRSCGRPDAARRLGNLVTALASGWDRGGLTTPLAAEQEI